MTVALVFVNYRTDDTAHAAAAIYERLVDLFGEDQVFRDARSLVPGVHSPSSIREAVRRADVLVAVIGPRWLEKDDRGARRIDDPEDWVRWEIATALRRGIPVVPVFLDDTTRPKRGQLPDDLSDLRKSQALRIRHQNLGPDMARLEAALTELVPALLLKHLFAQPPQLPDTPLPSSLLRAEYGIVPFAGRRSELDDLLAWCQSPTPLSAHLVTAPAGVGKTRLAVQLAAELSSSNWIAGVLAENAPANKLVELARLSHPLLLVIDYVEGRISQLEVLVEGIVAHGGHHSVRLLLLGRSAGDWLAQIRGSSNETINELFVNAGRLPLLSLVRPDDRHVEFTRAVQAFSIHLELPADSVVPPADLADGHYDRALDLHSAALAGLLDQADDIERTGDTRDPVLRVLDHEKRYWKRSAIKVGDDRATLTMLGYVVALATMFGARTREQAVELLAHWISDRTRLSLVLAWLQEMYPGDDVLNPLRPDRLGEDHAAAELRTEPGLATEQSQARSPEQTARALTVLGRAAPRHRELAEVISLLVKSDPDVRVPLAMDVATQLEDPTPLVQAISSSMTDADDPLVDLAVKNLPETTEALGEFGVETLKRAIHIHERLSPRNRQQLAQLNLRLGNALRALTRSDQALVPIQNAAQAFTELAKATPDAFLPFEAQAFNSLALTHRELGHYGEALETIELALNRYGSLSSGGAAAYRKILADAMDTRAVCLYELQRAPEALAVATETLALRKQLAEEQPALYRGGYGAALNNAALRNREAGNRQAAVEHARNAVDTYEQLAADYPDAFRRDHAAALSTLALTETDVGRPETALRVINQSAELFDKLAAVNPEAHLPHLAVVTTMRAIRLGDAGFPEEALIAAQDAVKFYQELVRTRAAVFGPYLAMALNALANRRAQLGQLADALTDATRAVELSRQPSADGMHQWSDLAVALNTRGMTLWRLNQLDDAQEVLNECVRLRRKLAHKQPRAFRPDLAGSLRNLARVIAASDEHEMARPLFDEAVDIYVELATDMPGPFREPLVDTLLELADLPDDPAAAVSALAAAWTVASPAADQAAGERIRLRLVELTTRHGKSVQTDWNNLELPVLPTDSK